MVCAGTRSCPRVYVGQDIVRLGASYPAVSLLPVYASCSALWPTLPDPSTWNRSCMLNYRTSCVNMSRMSAVSAEQVDGLR